MKKLFYNLTFWVLTAILAGALLGYFAPQKAISMQFLGTKFIGLVTLFIYPIIFLTISIGISSMGDLKKVGRVGGKALLYFEIVTTAALLIGVLVMKIFQPGSGVSIWLSKPPISSKLQTWFAIFQLARSRRSADFSGSFRSGLTFG